MQEVLMTIGIIIAVIIGVCCVIMLVSMILSIRKDDQEFQNEKIAKGGNIMHEYTIFSKDGISITVKGYSIQFENNERIISITVNEEGHMAKFNFDNVLGVWMDSEVILSKRE